MTTLFEEQGGRYELQGDYRLPCVTLPNDSNYEIGVWGERHRRYLKEHHRVRYYNFLTAGTLDNYLEKKNYGEMATIIAFDLASSCCNTKSAVVYDERGALFF